MARASKVETVKVEIVAADQQPRPDPVDLVRQLVDRRVAEILANRDNFIFQPYFEERRIRDELVRLQSVAHQQKWHIFFEKYGCEVCGRKDVGHHGLGRCQPCYTRTKSRLREIVKRYRPKSERPDYSTLDDERIAREALTGTQKALPAPSRRRKP